MRTKIILFFSLFVGIVLIIAAMGKIFFPIASLVGLERTVGVFEILFFLAIFFLRNQWHMWLAAAVIFGGWGGFALYWVKAKLPCNCMGAMLPIPSELSFALDLIFYFGSLILGAWLGARKECVYASFLFSLLSALVGFAFADCLLAYTL
jgi:hypothetical protein